MVESSWWHILIDPTTQSPELLPLPDHSSEGVAYVILNKMLSKFGALVEVFTNQGTEFQGDF